MAILALDMIRTRFAPSPTGYLHIGGARTALFSWAFARKLGGQFILRIEDTDLERSTPESVKAILDAMAWLKLDYDEGPFYQTERMERYRVVIQQLLDEGKAYRCYCSKEELDAMREQQRAAGLKPRYDGRWRDSKAVPPEGVQPAIRFKNPLDGAVVIDDLVKGAVIVQNGELDDLIIARADGSPTYNFCVVVDDWDMNITHVIRGDDHLNNTPRQINILEALGAELPQYAHVPMILGPDGERLSKRHGAVSVMQYAEAGYLPEALLNYLARLSWSHGDEEVFSIEQFVEWFDVEHVAKSPAKFNPEKLLWLNQHYIKEKDTAELAELIRPHLTAASIDFSGGPNLEQVTGLLKERASTLLEFIDLARYFYHDPAIEPGLAELYLTSHTEPLLSAAAEAIENVQEWDKHAIARALKSVVEAAQAKFPALAMPLRVALTGTTQTPSIDATIEILGRETTLARLRHALATIHNPGSSNART